MRCSVCSWILCLINTIRKTTHRVKRAYFGSLMSPFSPVQRIGQRSPATIRFTWPHNMSPQGSPATSPFTSTESMTSVNAAVYNTPTTPTLAMPPTPLTSVVQYTTAMSAANIVSGSTRLHTLPPYVYLLCSYCYSCDKTHIINTTHTVPAYCTSKPCISARNYDNPNTCSCSS